MGSGVLTSTERVSRRGEHGALRVTAAVVLSASLVGFATENSDTGRPAEATQENGNGGGTVDAGENSRFEPESENRRVKLPDSTAANIETDFARKRTYAYKNGGSYDVDGDGIDETEIVVKDGVRRMLTRDSNGEVILVLESAADGTVQQWDLRLSGDQLVSWRSGGHSISREDSDNDGVIDTETEVILDHTTKVTEYIVRNRVVIENKESWQEVWRRKATGENTCTF